MIESSTSNEAETLIREERYDEAELCLKQLLESEPASAGILETLGRVYLAQGRNVEAVAVLVGATQQDPAAYNAHYYAGLALKALGEIDEAIASFRSALAGCPDCIEMRIDLALALLLDGQLEEGFEEYEWRFKAPGSEPPFSSPMWDGRVDINGTLLVWAAESTAHIIQFIRYVPLIAQHGMNVVVQCPGDVQSIVECVEGVKSTTSLHEPSPFHTTWIPLLSLPRLFETRMDRIPKDIPYVLPPFGKVKAWREKLSGLPGKVKVGLSWIDEVDGVPFDLNQLRSLAGLPGVSFIGLDSVVPHDAEAAEKIGLVCFPKREEFTDEAALISNLDLVISINRTVIDLAGALGKPVWAMVPFIPEWRWMLDRNDSPWYPRLRLFRQGRGEGWESASSQVVAMLSEAMRQTLEEE